MYLKSLLGVNLAFGHFTITSERGVMWNPGVSHFSVELKLKSKRASSSKFFRYLDLCRNYGKCSFHVIKKQLENDELD